MFLKHLAFPLFGNPKASLHILVNGGAFRDVSKLYNAFAEVGLQVCYYWVNSHCQANVCEFVLNWVFFSLK